MGQLRLEFCGEWVTLPTDRSFAIGRETDFEVDDNPYLHRRFLELRQVEATWWLANVGSQLAATLSDVHGRFQAFLGPGAHIPVVFEVNLVRFTAGPTSYELALHLDQPPYSTEASEVGEGTTTLGRTPFTADQHLLVVALCEPALRSGGTGASSLPTSAQAASRLGWALTKFNRKLDNVCEKLTRAGVQGLHGGADRLAANRRARLVEYALATRLVTPSDLELLDEVVAR